MLSIVYLFRILEVVFSSITRHMGVVLKSHCLFMVDAKPFLANENVKYECFLCAFQIWPMVYIHDVYADPKQCDSNR